jgi:hypothetical protein
MDEFEIMLVISIMLNTILMYLLIRQWSGLSTKKMENDMKKFEMIYNLDKERIKSNR